MSTWINTVSLGFEAIAALILGIHAARLARRPPADYLLRPPLLATKAKHTLVVMAVAASLVTVCGWTRITQSCLFGLLLYLAQTCASVAAASLHHVHHAYSTSPSDMLLLYWPATALVSLVSLWVEPSLDHHVLVASRISYILLVLAVFCLEFCCAPVSPFALSDGDEGSAVYENAHVYSRISFAWFTPKIDNGHQEQREITDRLSPIPRSIARDELTVQALSNWNQELRKTLPSLLRVLCKGHTTDFIISGVCLFVAYTFRVAQPVILKLIIQYFQTYGTPQGHSIEYGLMLCVCMAMPGVGKTMISQKHWEHIMRPWLHFIRTLSMLVYRKVLCISNESTVRYSTGEIVSYLSTDVERVASLVRHTHELWVYPLQTIVLVYMLYTTIGWSCLVGVALLVVETALGFYLNDAIGTSTRQFTQYRDKRMRVISEAIGNIKAIKMYAWERAFIDKIESIRNDEELAAMWQTGSLKTLLGLSGSLMSIIITGCTFGTYALFDGESHGPLESQLIFVSLSLFLMLNEPLSGWIQTLSMSVDASTSYSRLYSFLTSTDRDPDAVTTLAYDRYAGVSTSDDILVYIGSGSFKWITSGIAILEDINFECHREELVAVVGKVGSGKSSLISALLGDMVKISGLVAVRGSVALVPQQPWITNTTLRDNILFGNRFEQAFYEKVIDACALRTDIELLAGGDMTEIGEKGINLSGGQKARVSLARAVYSRADIYLLDDPLSAVDAHVGRHIFNHVIGPKGLLKDRARVLVTNDLQCLCSADRVLLLQNGRAVERETIPQIPCSQNLTPLSAQEYSGDTSPLVSPATTLVADNDSQTRGADENTRTYSETSMPWLHTHDRAEQNGGAFGSGGELCAANSGSHSIIKDETEHIGQVGRGVFTYYIRACGVRNIVWLIVTAVVSILLELGSKLWLARWAHANEGNRQSGKPSSTVYYLSVYSAIAVFSILANIADTVLIWLVCGYNSSRCIHSLMLRSIMRAPISYLESIPIGRILGLFGSDQIKVDMSMPGGIEIWLHSWMQIAITLILICMASPLALLFLVPLGYLFVSIQNRYLPTTRDIRRFINTSRNRNITSIEEAIHGAVSIRAYSHREQFEVSWAAKIERYTAALWTSECADKWLKFRLDAICVAILFLVMLILVGAQYFSGYVDGGFAGLTLTYSASMLGMLSICIRSTSLLEMAMVSVERLRDYSFLESEAPEVIEDHRPFVSWPEAGVIEFRKYSTKYRDSLDLVLRNVSFTVQPNQKVGVVGRTGAGKSTLALSLLRIIEPTSGQIFIDGEDIAKLGLYDIRSRISVIPQDPVMFAGAVRENLDPFCIYSDDEIWHALDSSHLGDFFRSNDERLEFAVTQGGRNFSVGQRQLICLARALLKRSKILVLDEATAAIDNTTDSDIQHTIREQFKDCTVLTIAHRLNTVIDSDMILVVEKGQVAEYDSPQNLLANKSSMFAKLVEEVKSGASD